MRNRFALFALLLGACGKVGDLTEGAESGGPDASVHDAPGGGAFDASWRLDAVVPDVSTTVDVEVPRPDGGPGPDPPCADAALPCALPPSECVDDHWLRGYTNGRCTDAGTCAFDVYEMLCPPSPMPPDCYQGGCRIVIVR
jgi:hypothetical protein